MRYLTIALIAAVITSCAGASATTTTQHVLTTTSSTSAPPVVPRLPDGVETLELGETWAFTMNVGCGEGRFFNGISWVVSERFFEHPDYPASWPVVVLNLGAVDGPDAQIEATLTLVDGGHIDVHLADGTPVAVYEPGEPFFCG
jgi:hypothetical protein